MTRGLEQLKEKVLGQLERWPGLAQVTVLGEYRGPHQAAVEEPLIVVGVDSVVLEPAGLGGFLGQAGGEQVAQFGLWGKVVLRFDCLVGIQGDWGVHRLFEELCQCLLLGDLGVEKLWCEEISPTNKGAFGSCLVAKAEMAVCLAREEKSSLIEGFVVKRG